MKVLIVVWLNKDGFILSLKQHICAPRAAALTILDSFGNRLQKSNIQISKLTIQNYPMKECCLS